MDVEKQCKLFRRLLGGFLAATLLISMALAAQEIPLPTTPPQVDDTPVSHQPEPENFRESAAPTPAATTAAPLEGVNRQPEPEPPLPAPPVEEGMETGYAVLIGGVIWYAIMVIGVAGGRRGLRRRREADRY